MDNNTPATDIVVEEETSLEKDVKSEPDIEPEAKEEPKEVLEVEAEDDDEAEADSEKETSGDLEKADKTRKKRSRRKFSYYFTNGIIFALLSKLTEYVYGALVGGLFGRIFTAYSKEQKDFESGHIKTTVLGNSKLNGRLRNIRMVFAEAFENSFLPGLASRITRVLLETSLKNYGNFMLSAGLYTVFSFFVRRFVAVFETASLAHFTTGVVLVSVSIPLLMSKSSLAKALGSSVSARALFCEAFGIRDESFDIPLKQSKTRANLSIVFGMTAGLLTLVVSPLYIPITIFLLVSLSLVLTMPEIGVICALFLLPFLSLLPAPSLTLAAIVGFSALGYLVKLVRGKRILKFEIIDVAILFFLIALFFSGVFSAGGAASLGEAGLACMLMLVYFLVANTMRTEKWADRCVMALVASAGVTAVIGVLEYFFGNDSARWLDLSYFGDIRTRVVALFDNANVLAFYLVMIFPFALNLIFKSKRRGEKFLSMFCALAIVLCVVFTWSRGAWLGLIVAMLVFLLIKTRMVLKAFFGFCLALPLVSVILPSNVVNRFMSIGDLSDSSTYYRVLTWRGSLSAIIDSLWGGYGYGTSAFEAVYPSYAIAGIEAAEHTHSLFLQILFSMGIVGLSVFIIVMVLFAQKNLEFFTLKDTKGKEGLPAAAFSAIVAALVMGLFDNIWYNNRIFFLFFAIMGISTAVIRMRDESVKRKSIEVASDCSSACIDI